MRRFEKRWQRWDAAVAEGERPADFLPRISDESLVELLASGHPEHRRFELNLIGVELQNRLVRLRMIVGEAAAEAVHAIDAAVESADEAVDAAVDSEGAVLRHIEVRRDEVDGEPAAAARATDAAAATREDLRQAEAAREKLRRAEAEATRRSRHRD